MMAHALAAETRVANARGITTAPTIVALAGGDTSAPLAAGAAKAS